MSLPRQFWINVDTGRIIPAEYKHEVEIEADPETFGYTRDDLNGKLDWDIAFNRGWVRASDATSDSIGLETNNLRDAARTISRLFARGETFSDLFLEFDHGRVEREPIQLEGTEEIEMFAKTGRLPRRITQTLTAPIATRRNIPEPAADVISAMRTKVGTGVGDRMESFIEAARDKRLVETLRPDKVTIPFEGSAKIIMSKDANQFYRMQSSKYRRQIADHLRALETTPYPPGSEKLELGAVDGESTYRLRVGTSRIVYGVQGSAQNPVKILIYDIGHRKEIYRNHGM